MNVVVVGEWVVVGRVRLCWLAGLGQADGAAGLAPQRCRATKRCTPYRLLSSTALGWARLGCSGWLGWLC